LIIIGDKKDPIAASPDTHVIDFAYIGEPGDGLRSGGRAANFVGEAIDYPNLGSWKLEVCRGSLARPELRVVRGLVDELTVQPYV
jgi:hypothetical protein